MQQLSIFRHTFSHFHLDIIPVQLKIRTFKDCIDKTKGLWYDLANPPEIGLAAPVKRLLQQTQVNNAA